MPERIQLRRTKGWRKPEGVITVARPTRWGNPFFVEPAGPEWGLWSIVAVTLGRPISVHGTRDHALDAAVDLFELCVHDQEVKPNNILVPTPAEIREHLGGRDLGCWCRLDRRCHGDVYLAVASP